MTTETLTYGTTLLFVLLAVAAFAAESFGQDTVYVPTSSVIDCCSQTVEKSGYESVSWNHRETAMESETELYRHVAVEIEPVAYILGGAGIHGRYQHGNRRFAIEVFGLDIPESLHGNDGFDATVFGIELHMEYFFSASGNGWFFGPEISISRFEAVHRASGISEVRTRYGAGLRGGYRWYPGFGDLYLSPTAGMVHTLNAGDIEIQDNVFESGPVTPFATVGIGWSFEF